MSLQKQIFILFGIFFSIFLSNAQDHSLSISTSDSVKPNYLMSNGISVTDSIVNYGKMYLNKPYRHGSPGADSFDCSGFTSFVYRNFGYKLHHSSAEQAGQFDTVNRNEIRIGDLVYFAGRWRSSRVGHVGIVVAAKENGEFDFIHAAVHSGVIISNSSENYYTKRYIKANRVIAQNPMLTIFPSLSKTENTIPESIIPIPFSTPVKQTNKIIGSEYHHVKSGETLSSIALKYGISLAELKQKNNIKSNKIIRNQRLKVKDEEAILVTEPITEIADNSTKVLDKTNKPETEELEITSTELIVRKHRVRKGEIGRAHV